MQSRKLSTWFLCALLAGTHLPLMASSLFQPNLIEPDAKYREGQDEATTPKNMLPEKKYLEEQDLVEFEKWQQEQEKNRKALEKKRREEQRRREKMAEEARKAMEERRREAEARRLAEEKRLEAIRIAEEKRQEEIRKAEEEKQRLIEEARRVAEEQARREAEAAARREKLRLQKQQLILERPFRPGEILKEYGASYFGLYAGAVVGTGIGIYAGRGIQKLMNCSECGQTTVQWNARFGALAGTVTMQHLMGAHHEKYASWPVTLMATAVPTLLLPSFVSEDFNFSFAGPDVFYVLVTPAIATMTYNIAWRYNEYLPDSWQYKKRQSMPKSVSFYLSADPQKNVYLNYSLPL